MRDSHSKEICIQNKYAKSQDIDKKRGKKYIKFYFFEDFSCILPIFFVTLPRFRDERVRDIPLADRIDGM